MNPRFEAEVKMDAIGAGAGPARENRRGRQASLAPLAVWLAASCLGIAGCNAAFVTGVANGISRGAEAGGGTSAQTKLMIFGGPDHKTYLGCMNCSKLATDSVSNEYGSYGSPYEPDSIWNHYGDFGSPYSDESACNPYATDPPVIVDQNGNAYGRLTVNPYNPDLGIGAKLQEWLKQTVCVTSR